METSQAVRTTQEIANKLVEYCRQGNWEAAQQELYADNAISMEPEATGWPVAEGREALKQKGEKWSDSMEAYHGSEVSDPLVAGNHFSVRIIMDFTPKGGPRVQSEELAVYQVHNGKVVKEQFFYDVE